MHSIMYGKCIRLFFHSVCVSVRYTLLYLYLLQLLLSLLLPHCCCCSLVNLGRIFVGAPRDVVELEKDLSHNEASFRWASAAVAAAAGCGVGVALKGTTTTTVHLHIADVASLLQFGPDSDWARPLLTPTPTGAARCGCI